MTTVLSRLMVACVALGVASAAAQEPPAAVRQGQSGQPFGYAVAFGGRARWLAHCASGAVRIFDVASGRVTRTLSLPALSGSACAGHPTDDVVALATSDAAVIAFDAITGVERWRTKPLARAWVYMPGQMVLGFSSDGRELHARLIATDYERLMSGGIAGMIRRARGAGLGELVVGRWASSDGRLLSVRKMKLPREPATSNLPSVGAKTSLDGSRELVAQISYGWRIIDTRSGDTTILAPPSTPVAYDWALTPDGRRIGTVQGDTLVIGDLVDQVTYHYPGGEPANVRLVTMSDLRDAQTDSLGGEAAPAASKAIRELSLTTKPAAAFTDDGRWFVARAADGRLDVWDTTTGTHMPFRLDGPTDGYQGSAQLPIVVRPRGQARPGDGWRPIEIAAVAGDAVCRSIDPRFTVERFTGGDGFAKALLRERSSGRILDDLLAKGLDLSGGCRVSPDATRVLVVGVQPSPILAQEIPMRHFGQGLFAREADIVIADLRQPGAVVALQDRGTGRAGRFPFGPAVFDWSPDGRFVVAGGAPPIGPLRVWNTGTGRELDLSASRLARARRSHFQPGGADLFVVPDGETFGEVWNLDTLQRVGERLSHAPSAADAMNGTVVVTPAPDGYLEIRRLTTGERLGELGVFKGGDWLVTTPSGAFDGSPGGWQRLVWRTQAGLETAPGELFFDEFYRPGLLAQLLEGSSPVAAVPLESRDRRQPSVALTARMDRGRSASVKLEIQEATGGSAADGSGVRDVRLFRNGLLVDAWRGEQRLDGRGTIRLESQVPVAAGRNVFTAYAFNRDNVKSVDAVASLDSGLTARPATVYVLAIGVNEYANPEFNLAYARADAEAFARELGARQRALATDADVRVVTLLDAAATRANILLALRRLAGTADAVLAPGVPRDLQLLETVQPEDTVLMYFAGHGVAQGDRFFLIPADIAYRGKRAEAAAALPQVVEHAISDRDLERALEPLDAAHLALIIDACQAGQLLGPDGGRFGPMNSRGLAQLAYEKGMSILAASQAYQAALESARLGHGYLTFALVEEGLKSDVADRTPTDGAVTIEEWFEHAVRRVPELQSQAIDAARETGRALRFEVGPTRPWESRVQTPRAFARRDAPAAPLIITRP
jgi:uncharacterized caspase-like protein/WD40 repeat protein